MIPPPIGMIAEPKKKKNHVRAIKKGPSFVNVKKRAAVVERQAKTMHKVSAFRMPSPL